jgi:hypothetical protein
LAEEYKERVYHLMYWLWSRSDRNVEELFLLSGTNKNEQMADYIFDFTLTGNKYYNGKYCRYRLKP